jgi:hypothetical protein
VRSDSSSLYPFVSEMGRPERVEMCRVFLAFCERICSVRRRLFRMSNCGSGRVSSSSDSESDATCVFRLRLVGRA